MTNFSEKNRAEKLAKKEAENEAAIVASTASASSNTEVVKFGVKAKEQPKTNVQKANVLEELNKGKCFVIASQGPVVQCFVS